MNLKKITQNKWLDISYLPLIASAAVTTFVILLVYNQSQQILKERLRERLISIAATAALQIDPNDIKKMQKENRLDSPELTKIISITRKVRDANSDIKYIYIWSQTNDANTVAFTSDAEMLQPIDRDGNGKIDGIEIPPKPGEPYDITNLPEVHSAFYSPTAQNNFIIDKWGTFLSGFAPIKDEKGKSVAVLGMDVEVGDYYNLIRAAFVPFLLLAILLLLMLGIQTVMLTRIWRTRVDFIKELDRQKDELLGIVSHQLAAPITAIKWYLELLLDDDIGSLNKEQETQIKTMQGVAVNLSDLVSMILDVSRIQLGKIRVEKQDVDLNEFLKDIFEVIEPKISEKGQTFIKNFSKEIPKVKIDKRLTRMAIENLLTNAVKYTPKNGKIELGLGVKNGTLECYIRDSGLGIPKIEQPKIFEKLFRASNVKNSIEGNGFGLYVAKGSTETQGGKIWFESEEGKGTTFHLEIPNV